MDDSYIHHIVPFSENVDYLSSNYISDYHLYICWRQNNSISINAHKEDISVTIPLTISRRLENISWRRLAKQQRVLSEILPSVINWNKHQDVTWLYGPKYTSRCPYENDNTTNDNSSNCINDNTCAGLRDVYDSDDCAVENDDVSADGTCLELTRGNLHKWNDINVDSDDSASFRLTSSMTFETESIASDNESDDNIDAINDYCHLKPVLKQRSNPFVPSSKSKKQVKFSYVINSREYSNELLYDYYFLDTLCL